MTRRHLAFRRARLPVAVAMRVLADAVAAEAPVRGVRRSLFARRARALLVALRAAGTPP